MPEQTYALEPGGPKRLKVSWSAFFSNVKIELDGRPVGSIDGGKSAMAKGGEFSLGDGTTLSVKLETSLTPELRLLRDGKPIPGSQSDPEQRLKGAWGVIFFIAAINGLVGVIAPVFNIRFLLDAGMSWNMLIPAAIYAALGAWVRARRSKLALGITMAMFVADGIATAMNLPGNGGFVARMFLLIPMWKGFGAISELDAQNTSGRAEPPIRPA